MSPEHSDPVETPLTDQTDAELYRALKTGQMEALGILYDRHAGLVHGLACRTLGNPQEAEDLTQDVFLSLVRTNSYQPNRGSLRTFLAILTRSRAIDRMRSRSAALRSLQRWQSEPSQSSTSSLETLFQTEQSQEVQAALAQLSTEQQQILRLAYYDGLSQSRIAEQLNIPLGTVKTRSRQGLLKLRQTLSTLIESPPQP
jgi:RNA polymerase sigma-70 factor (ECF subfamily)